MVRFVFNRVLLAVAGLLAISNASLYAQSLAEARERFFRGNYLEAREKYEAIQNQVDHPVAATLGVSRCHEAEGDLDLAVKAIETALTKNSGDSDLLARLAELQWKTGRWDDAEGNVKKALVTSPDHFAARWVQARLANDRGELEAADSGFRWFVRTYTARNRANQDIKDPDQLMIVADAGSHNARWHRLSDQFRFILNEVYGDVLKLEPLHWPAEVQAGLLLLEKYNRTDALKAFDKALVINPRAAEAMIGKGLVAMQFHEYREAELFAQQALQICPRSTAALKLLARIHLNSGELSTADQLLKQALSVNPRDEEALGIRAAGLHLHKGRQADLDKLTAEVAAIDSKPARFHAELAEQLEGRRHYADAEKHYRKALEYRPHFYECRTNLGLLALRIGKEDEARTLLKEAFQFDPFNVRVGNSLRVLKHLDNYDTIKTEHFIVRFDPTKDALLARYLSEQLEPIYAEYSKQYDCKPPGPFKLEIFNSHEMFSGRVIALPDLHTVGACTGPVVAMASPKANGLKKPFNWGRVIRHELTHVFNLEQTNYQVPHWLTEGLSVCNEGFPRPPVWNSMLLDHSRRNQLFNLTNIDLGFIRPKSQNEWGLAYAQAQLYVELIRDEYGPERIGKLLAAYRDGAETTAAIESVCETTIAEFEAKYKGHVRKVVESFGRLPPKPMTLRELETAHAKTKDDAEIAVRLSEQYLKRRRTREAKQLIDDVLDRQADNGGANYVKAQMLKAAGDEDGSRRLLETAAAQANPDPRALRALGKLYIDLDKAEDAAPLFEKGRTIEPLNTVWLEELARTYKILELTDKRIAVMAELAPYDPDDLDIRTDLAALLLEAKRPNEALRWARQAVEIDVTDAVGQSLLLKSLEALERGDEAKRLRELFRK